MSTCTSQARLTFLLALCLLGTLSWGLAPTITSFTPTRGLVGTVVTIHGTNLFDAIPTTTVKCNGIVSPADTRTLTIVIGAGATTGKLSVTTPGGTATSEEVFTVLQPPAITAVTPNIGVAGQVVNIYGTNLLEITALKLNGIPMPYTIVNAGTQISFKLPVDMTSGLITISTQLAGTATSSSPFVVDTSAAPTITSFTPTIAKIGAKIIITGTNFTSAQKVVFINGASFTYHNDPQFYYSHQASFSVVNDTTISAFVPSDALDGPITVITAGGTVVSTTSFTRLLPPEIVSLSAGPYYIGNIVTILGRNFQGVTSVTFAGMPGAFTVINSMTLTAKIPMGAKDGVVTINQPGGSGSSFVSGIHITPLATISTYTRTARVADTVTITGTGFIGAKKVKFNGVETTNITVLNATTMTAKVPAGATTGFLTVVASDLSSAFSQDYVYIYNETVNTTDNAKMTYIPSTGDFYLKFQSIGSSNYSYKWIAIDGYWIYQKEVTVAQYRAFCTATNRAMPSAPSWGWQDTHPIVNVSWNDAKAYADWAGVQLPTEAQWAKADIGIYACGSREYPWFVYTWSTPATAWDITKCANYYNSYNVNGHTGTWPIGSFPTGASPYGVLDMSGNAAEWCNDWFDYTYKGITGPSTGAAKVIRGGSWFDTENNLTTGARTFGLPDSTSNTVGFRCVSTRPAP
ncbi:MAG: SUMF1/EgtB/PvdO family nonheme iron enzyme [bacterium]